MHHILRRKQIKVLDIKWISKELLIAPGPQTDQLLFQPMLCIPNSHFTHLHTNRMNNHKFLIALCLISYWWNGGAIQDNATQLDGLWGTWPIIHIMRDDLL